MRKKRRTAAQRAATKKLIAFNRRRARGGVKRKRNPARRTAYKGVRRATTTRRRAPARRRATAVRRRRNPIKRTGVVNGIVMPAVTAASGALALDIAWAYLPLPAQVKSGNLKYAAKALGAIGLSMAAGMVVKKKTADAMGIGALTVVAHQLARDLLSKAAPTLKMDGMGYYSPGLPVGAPESDMGLYVNGMPQGNQGREQNMGLYINGYSSEGGYTYS